MPIVDCKIHPTVKIWHPELVNLYGCKVDERTKIGTFVEIGKNVFIGKDCKIQSHAFIPEGVLVKDNVFIGPGVVFCNVKYPMQGKAYQTTIVGDNAIIGANATILPGIRLGMNSIIGAGSVVTRDVGAGITVVGNPANPILVTEKVAEPELEFVTQETTLGKFEMDAENFTKQNPDFCFRGFQQEEIFNNPGMKIQPYPTKWSFDDRNKGINTYYRFKI